ncbi:MAG: GspE/PulE family protein [Clostridia bacterium]|nr:GspE/PulE family protein [Clostridia bacterium]
MKNFSKKRLGDILVEVGLISDEQLKEVLSIQKGTGKKLGEILTDKGYVTKKSMIEVLEFQLGIPYVNLAIYHVEPKIVRMIPENMARKYEIVPIKFENNILTVAASDPLNAISFDDVRIYTGFEVQPVMADGEQINSLIARHFNSQKAMEVVEEFSRANNLLAKNQTAVTMESDTANDVSESPAVKLINILIEQACQSDASDIHIEPQNRNVRIRFRIDGQLQDMMQSDIEILPSIVSRIKVMAGLNIAEKRLPQDGRITYKMANREVDLRISVLPAIFGEKVVIRVISKETFDYPKERLGFLPENLAAFDSILKNPHGIILVTGPTGSGKTTTLYTAIKELNKANVNIVTVEDPVESTIEGITQVPVNPKAGLSFASALRSILRQDPDIVLIGEIRDAETAEIAVRAAITGHLVLSTLHTNDAASSVARLIDMGIQPFLVSTSVVGVVAQRLVRRICTNCKESYIPTDNEMEQFGPLYKEKPVFYKGRGCEVCKGTGYKGRVAVHEVMKIGAEHRQAIYKEESADILKDIAARSGMITLRENCKKLVLEGMTTYEEMIKVAYVQE